LVSAAWCGQDPAGRWRPRAWRYVALAGLGFAALCLGLHHAGTIDMGQHYPP
jgi:hypothetical protein